MLQRVMLLCWLWWRRWARGHDVRAAADPCPACRVRLLDKRAGLPVPFPPRSATPVDLELFHELGWLEELLALPHSHVAKVSVGSPAGRRAGIAAGSAGSGARQRYEAAMGSGQVKVCRLPAVRLGQAVQTFA